MSRFVMHTACDSCGSSDALAVYLKEDGTYNATCFSCESFFPEVPEPTYKRPTKKMQNFDFDSITSLPIRGWRKRNIGKPVSEFYGVYSKMDGEEPVSRNYPVYLNNEVVGYKVRNCVKKDFYIVGIAGKHCQFFGQHLFPPNGKFLVITEGEEDALSAFQMLTNDKYKTPVVSGTNGAEGITEQIKANYKWVSSFETVVLCFDNDEPGKKAAEQCARVLKPGQAKIMDMRLKDANEYLASGNQSEFVSSFWRAERYSPAGIIGSSNTWDALIQRAKFVKIPLPAFAEDLQKMLNGGIALSEITTIAGASGLGKSSVTYEFIYHWIFNSEYKVGVISLENDLGELTENLMSIHLNRKLAIMPDETKLEFYKSEEVRSAHNELTTLPDGSDRFIILDHQGDMIDGDLQNKIEYLVKVNNCKIIILDPMTLALSGRGLDSTDQFMSWLVAFVKREQVAHINVVHVRKAQGGQKAGSAGGTIHEEDAKGCLDAMSEYLSPTGWRKMCDYDGGYVAQWEQGVLSFVKPEYIVLPSTEKMIRFSNANSLDMVVSPEHRMLISGEVRFAKDVAAKVGRGYIPTNFVKFSGTRVDEHLIRLMVACAADACYYGNGLAKAEFKKARKIERFRSLLALTNTKFTETKNSRGNVTFRFRALTENKPLDECFDWYQATSKELGILVDECVYWDGTVKGTEKVFFTSKKEEADVVQYASHASGLVSRIRRVEQGNKLLYTVSIANLNSPKNSVMLRGDNCKVEYVDSTDGYKYCFTVPSSFFLARHNDRVFVTGNSSSIFQNSMNNILIMRDKENADPEVRNTTRVVLSKSRRTGNTGPAGFWKYNNVTSRLEAGKDPNGNYEVEEKIFDEVGANKVQEEDF